MRIGGVDIEFDRHLAGHSDADVLLHAITDSILGAANMGDIGQLFPDNDPANRGKDSGEMLSVAYGKIVQEGWELVNLDAVVLAERPKIAPHSQAIRECIARILNASPDQVSVKGKTGEGTGEVGEGKIIQAMCVCLLRRLSGA